MKIIADSGIASGKGGLLSSRDALGGRDILQAILGSLTAQIAVLDSSGNIVLVNEAWERFACAHSCFCIASARVGTNYLKLCRKGGAKGAEVVHAIQDVFNGSLPSFSHDFACHSAKEPRWFLLSVTPLDGDRPGVVVSRTDITAQKQAEAARAHLAAIVESSSSGITTTNLDGIVTSWNPGAEQLYGYAADEIIGKSVRTIVPRDRFHELDGALQKLRNGEPVETFETVRRRKDGRLVPIALTISAIKDAHGDIIGASGIARDVTERRRLEAEVLRATEREQRHIAQDLHDGLAQQVGGIACIAKVLRDELRKERSPHAASATKIANLLEDAGAQTRNLARGLYPVPAEPAGLMTALRALAAHTTEQFEVECIFICPRSVLLHDISIANHLYRIAQEAVANAVRHGKPKHIHIALSKTGAFLALGVRDDGRGIRRRRNHNGIGLRMMHYRANLVTGTLVVQRTSDGGTEVVCTVDRTHHASISEKAAV